MGSKQGLVAVVAVLSILLIVAVSVMLWMICRRPVCKMEKGNKQEQETRDLEFLGLAVQSDVTDDMLKEKSMCPRRVILSATTSPSRLPYLLRIFKLIDSRMYDGIELNLPRKFGSKQSTYTITKAVETFPKLSIHRYETDIGPLMKLLPTVVRHPKDALIFTMDDDTVYDSKMVADLLKAQRAINYQGVVCFHGFKQRDDVPFNRSEGTKRAVKRALPALKKVFSQARDLDVAEGFSMVSYPSELLDVEDMLTTSKLSKDCYRSDDIVISQSLEKRGVPRFKVPCHFGQVMQLSYGFEADALHAQQNHYKAYESCLAQAGHY